MGRALSVPLPAAFAFDANNAGHVYAATSGGDLLESRDARSTWTVLRKASV
jgi:hypothetical protein